MLIRIWELVPVLVFFGRSILERWKPKGVRLHRLVLAVEEIGCPETHGVVGLNPGHWRPSRMRKDNPPQFANVLPRPDAGSRLIEKNHLKSSRLGRIPR